jgi:hypothetical protein
MDVHRNHRRPVSERQELAYQPLKGPRRLVVEQRIWKIVDGVFHLQHARPLPALQSNRQPFGPTAACVVTSTARLISFALHDLHSESKAALGSSPLTNALQPGPRHCSLI